VRLGAHRFPNGVEHAIADSRHVHNRHGDDVTAGAKDEGSRIDVVVHPRRGAAAAIEGQSGRFLGPFVQHPKISTGAGDHFNSGFCLGNLLGFDNAACVLTGVTCSGYYVRNAQSPFMEDLAAMLRAWPCK
jgi:sugar/nucleoside kinase (ribokinase family)